ncbi:MAG: hypothetical protein ACD_73C00799G0001 [uncultured bacterium]|nr:MAG: hypothetical protein ACD_73C00799G0001 [uncultured bacterium]
MSIALDIGMQEMAKETLRLKHLFDEFLLNMKPLFDQGMKLNGSADIRLPDNISLTIPGIPSSILLTELSSFALSAGSACASGSGAGSYVIKALRGSEEEALSTIRISMGRWTTEENMNKLAKQLLAAFEKFKDMGFE